ncbi:hypothetical protein DB44_DK00050 [Candidatus Protochlamydia amoebophila]|uniref:Uncharacterized protein n=1 Tax=Candidatus Protochlamydia amoebophila TaxID=362787 RepID=A0A0C1H9C6_9BACT|nr:hypothetical protein DB44_DK00050 [Candidatus Protochlamydia amoebophila]
MIFFLSSFSWNFFLKKRSLSFNSFIIYLKRLKKVAKNPTISVPRHFVICINWFFEINGYLFKQCGNVDRF